MTAVTLSTLACNSPIIRDVKSAAGCGRGAPYIRHSAEEAGKRIWKVSAPDAPDGGCHAAREDGVGPKGPDAKRHAARGLLNLITLLSRCLDGGSGTAEDYRDWTQAVAAAQDQLEALYQSGLPRTFLQESTPAAVGHRVR